MSVAAGERLRAAREQKGFSIEDVAARLKVPARYVAAIEQGDIAALPEPTFVRGYVKAYARTVGIDAEELLAQLAPVEVKAPKPLVSMDKGTSVTPARRSAPRTPNFRGGVRRHHWIIGGVLAIVAAGWVVWPGHEDTGSGTTAVSMAPPPAAPVAEPVATTPVGTVPTSGGMVTVEVPLPGAAPAPVAAPAAPAGTTGIPLPAPASATTQTAVPAAPVAAQPVAASAPVAAAKPVAVAAPEKTVANAPRKGVYLKFHGTSWVELRDAGNVVIHTSIAMADSELTLDGKAPLTLTLGDAGAAEVWYNGSRVSLDRFPRGGVARVILGQGAR